MFFHKYIIDGVFLFCIQVYFNIGQPFIPQIIPYAICYFLSNFENKIIDFVICINNRYDVVYMQSIIYANIKRKTSKKSDIKSG